MHPSSASQLHNAALQSLTKSLGKLLSAAAQSLGARRSLLDLSGQALSSDGEQERNSLSRKLNIP